MTTFDPRFHLLNPFVARRAPTMAMKSAATSDAPPINPPSTSGIANNAAAFSGFTLPP